MTTFHPRCILFLIMIIDSIFLYNTLRCPENHSNISAVYSFTGGTCISIRDIVDPVHHESRWDECDDLNEYPYTWHTPQLDSMEKNNAMEAIIRSYRHNATQLHLYFRIGLIRDKLTLEESEHLPNQSVWWDSTKWRWRNDNSTLASTWPNNTAPWAWHELQSLPHEAWRCVSADPNLLFADGLEWFTQPCDEGLEHLVVCESSVAKATQSVSSGPKPPALNSQIILTVSFSVLLFIISAGAGLFWFVWRRRQITTPKDAALCDDMGTNTGSTYF